MKHWSYTWKSSLILLFVVSVVVGCSSGSANNGQSNELVTTEVAATTEQNTQPSSEDAQVSIEPTQVQLKAPKYIPIADVGTYD